ncbi:hypothetical protein ACIQ9P_07245 [Kitasatospora sp. NPDC094019]|uniref:hypothetical protein n=1 Tax=Kitasatospora sp. NPDC094019 TaxID=3364091 RepID=UPI0037FF03F6
MALTRVLLSSGRSIELSTVRLSSTYGGLLEGYPFRRFNDRKLERALADARDAAPSSPVRLVAPVRELPDVPPGAFGPVETLPAVTCVGRFTSGPVGADRDAVSYYSALTLVWFQATPVLPSGEDGDAALRDLPWERLAEDFEL